MQQEKNGRVVVDNLDEMLQAIAEYDLKSLWTKTLKECGIHNNEIVYNWNRDNTVPVNVVAQYIDNISEHKDSEPMQSLVDFTADYLMEEPSFFEMFDADEEYIASHFEKALSKEKVKISEQFSWQDFFDTMIERGWLEENSNIEGLLEQTSLQCNITLATPEELNFDSVTYEMKDAILGNDNFNLDWNNRQDALAFWTNAVTWLIQQQGYRCQDLFDEEKTKQSSFLSSLREEMGNLTGGCPYLTVLTKADASQINAFAAHDANSIKFPRDTIVGLFSHTDGSGSILGIELEHPLVVPRELIANISFEGAKRKYQPGYTVDETYGLTKDAWKTGMQAGDWFALPIKEVRDNIDLPELQKLVESALEKATTELDTAVSEPTL